MGTWGVSKKELIGRLVDCLDETEGDFDTKTLLETANFLRFYCPTSTSLKKNERNWKKMLKGLEKGEFD